MPTSVDLSATTARLAMPLLYAAQAQKEMFVNEALSRLDIALHAVCQAELAAPPADPQAGECWLVAGGATGEWAGHDDALAGYTASGWIFVAPMEGMVLHDLSQGHDLRYLGGWQRPAPVAEPTGGSTIDAEARAALGDLLEALRATGTIS